jgi:hypothetical protein
MQSAAILEMLRTEASTGKAPSGSDALAHLVHWLAAHAERLEDDDVRSLLTVGLSLYNTELEKSWNIDFESVVYASSLSTPPRSTTSDTPSSGAAESTHPDQARARAEAAIAALVEMRRPGGPGALSDAKLGRRWSDSPLWALTYRG